MGDVWAFYAEEVKIMLSSIIGKKTCHKFRLGLFLYA